MKTVQDVFATLKTEGTITTHPFCVYIRFADGTRSPATDCRNLRDCLLVGNGMLLALVALDAGGREYAVNVVFDERFNRP